MIQKYFVWPLVTVFLTTFSIAQAQQSGKVPEVGFFDAGTHSSASLRLDAFRHGLRELGYVEGKNIFIEYDLLKRISVGFPNLRPRWSA